MKMNKNFKVSVAMTTYNGEKYVEEQIKTILKSLRDGDELIISDDGSTDNTLKIIKSLEDKRINLIDGPKKGLKQNFNNAIKNSTGDIIFLSDQDDIWKENKVEEVLKEFENGKIILIQHDAVVIDENNNIIHESFAKHRKVKTGIIKNLIKNSYHGCCIAFRKELKKEILPIPENIYLHDEWIGLVAELNGKTKFIDEKLIKYRRHSSNTSSFKHLPIAAMIKNRIGYIRVIIIYFLKKYISKG